VGIAVFVLSDLAGLQKGLAEVGEEAMSSPAVNQVTMSRPIFSEAASWASFLAWK
jgi:hypothetical protein